MFVYRAYAYSRADRVQDPVWNTSCYSSLADTMILAGRQDEARIYGLSKSSSRERNKSKLLMKQFGICRRKDEILGNGMEEDCMG